MGTLFLIATPIGNLSDISLRAMDILMETEYIACEDTRKAGILLRYIRSVKKIETPPKKMLISYYEQNEFQRIPNILTVLRNDHNVAVISDAGTPAVSDPGFRLVSAAIAEGVPVDVIPGPSSVITALAISGFPTDKFLFIGYLPKKPGKRNKTLLELKNMYETTENLHPTLVLFEAPHRILSVLDELYDVYGDIPIALCRELTKIHQEVRRETITQAQAHFKKVPPRGEFVIVCNPEKTQ